MSVNLDKLVREIIGHLQDRGLVVFKCYPRSPELLSDAIYWDVVTAPGYREFIAAAEAVGARIITLFAREFSPDMIDDALERLAATGIDRDGRRSIEARMRELGAYEGYICEIELSFSHDGRTYIYDQATPWYEEMHELLEEIESSQRTVDQDRPLGGYYSNN
jgi:hypothetical protein